MRPANPTGGNIGRDVGTPQVVNLDLTQCHNGLRSGMIGSGRAKSAEFNNPVPGVRKDPRVPKNEWSRGCRRAESFWSWQWSPLWLLARRKKKSLWSSRSRSSPSTPASTSNHPARARRFTPAGPAPDLLTLACRVALNFPTFAAHLPGPLWAFPALSPIRPAGCTDRSKDRC
jgi:hypothetical protein